MTVKTNTIPKRPTAIKAVRQSVLLVATRKGAWLYRRASARAPWTADGPHFLGSIVSHLLRDPRDGRTVLAAAKTGQLGPRPGTQWKQIGKAMPRAMGDIGTPVDGARARFAVPSNPTTRSKLSRRSVRDDL